MVNKVPSKKKYLTPKSRIRNKSCLKCRNNKRRYSSSSFGRHLKRVHGPKWICHYCQTKYADKNSHKICFQKEKHLLLSFIESYEDIDSDTKCGIHPSNLNLSFIFDKKEDIYFSKKLKLGCGHFSNVYYAIHSIYKTEIALKTPKLIDIIPNYKGEAFILQKFDDENFYPKLIGYNEKQIEDYLPISLMGPNLFQFKKFYDKPFDKKTIINIALNLVRQLEYISSKNVLHHDIKPENVAVGVIKKSKFKSKELYLIDFGLSIYMDENYKEQKLISSHWRSGTTKYMSVNTHKKIKPTILDDIESLLYSLIELAGIKLPWDGIKTSNFQLNNILLEMKQNINIIKLCGDDYDFIPKIFCYLNKVNKKETIFDFDVIYEILEKEKTNNKNTSFQYEEDFCFIELLKKNWKSLLMVKILFQMI